MKRPAHRLGQLTLAVLLLSLLLPLYGHSAAASAFIPAASRRDVVYDNERQIVYISAGTQVLRYDMSSGQMLSPWILGGTLMGMDISPDGTTLAVADTTHTSTQSWFYLIDIDAGTNQKIIINHGAYEGGTYSVAYGFDRSLLLSSTFDGSGWVPLRRYNPASGEFQNLRSIRQDSMLTPSADRRTIGIEESNISSGPLLKYDVAQQTVVATTTSGWFTYEVGVSADGSQFALPTYGGTFIYNAALQKIGTLGQYAGGQPIGVIYHPAQELVYFAWAGSREVRAYDTESLKQVAAYDLGYTFQHTGNSAFTNGRLEISADGSLLFATVGGGVSYVRLAGSPVAHSQTVALAEDQSSSFTLSGSLVELKPASYNVLTYPTHGMLGGSVPNLTYTPAPNFYGTDTFQFSITQDGIESNIATVTLAVAPINDRPLVVDDEASTQVNRSVNIDVLHNDSDIDGDQLRITAISRASNGSVVINQDQTITYTPNPGYGGRDQFTYTLTDDHGGLGQATVRVAVMDPALPPQADNQTLALAEDTALAITLTGSLHSATNPTFVLVDMPDHGTLSGIAPYLTYTPQPNYHGPDSLQFKIVQGLNESNVATVTLTITSVNDNPLAMPDQATTIQNLPVSIAVLPNDSDIDGDELAVLAVYHASHGTVALAASGAISYTPDLDYIGNDTFDYIVGDGQGGTAIGTVSIRIVPPSALPIAYAQSVVLDEDTPAQIVLNGTVQPQPAPQYEIVAQPQHGTLVSNGKFQTYHPDANYNGSDSFSFRIVQNGLASSPATVELTVRALNDLPVAQPDSATTLGSESVIINVLANDSDIDADPLIISSVTRASHGSVIVHSDNRLAYTPDAQFSGIDSLFYTIDDGHGGMATAEVTIAVTSSAPPLALDQTLTLAEDTPVTITLTGELTDTANLTYTLHVMPAHGTLSVNGLTAVYTPARDFAGEDSFKFTLHSPAGTSPLVTVQLTVEPVNDAPITLEDTGSTPPGTTLVLDVLANDSDPEAESLTLVSVDTPVHGQARIVAQQLEYTADPQFVGTVIVTYTMQDASGAAATGTARITISAGGFSIFAPLLKTMAQP